MSTTLAPGVAPATLVPGDPAGPRVLATRLDAYAESAAAAAGQLRALDAGGWVGEAAEAFRHALAQVPERLERAVGAFAEAASALRAYASTLEEAQQRARLALARVEAAEADTAAWRGRLAAHHAALATEAGGGPPAGPAPSAWNGPPPTRPTSPGSGPRPGTPPGSSSPGRPRPPWS
ncbi:MAG: hypothetical protein KY458_07585 [Actinobacteria bacterium]|nr:hypothetical protein [Actinomycetota bacterium]